MRTSCKKAWWRSHKSFIHNSEFEKVFGQCAGVQIVVIGFTNSAQEAHWAGPAELKVEHTKHEALSLQNFFRGVAIVNHEDDFVHRRAINFLVLGGNEQCCGADQLQFSDRDDLV